MKIFCRSNFSEDGIPNYSKLSNFDKDVIQNWKLSIAIVLVELKIA